MSRYSVDLDQLLAFTDRLAKFNQRVEEIAASVEEQVLELHGTWAGIGAEAEQEYHRTWMRLAQEMRETAVYLRESASLAHRNFSGVGEQNRTMWP
ncbi:hypothetical protein BH10ACT9_BH10ACT9_43980 [soil metagenome]